MPFERDFDYIVFKGLHALVISNHYDETFRVLSCIINFDKTVLETIKDIVDYYEDFLDEQIEDNVVKIVNYFRDDYIFESQEEKEMIYNMCNDIIIKINSKRGTKNVDKLKQHILSEYKSREFNISKNLIKGIDSIPESYFELVKDFNYCDFRILVYTSILVSDEDFEEFQNDFFLKNPFFINSLNILLDECPSLIENPLFRDRTKTCLKSFKEYIDANEVYDSKAKELANKRYKVYMKKLEEN